MALEQMTGEIIGPRRDRAKNLLGQLLGGDVQTFEIIAAVMQEIADFLVRHQDARLPPAFFAAGIDLVQHVQTLTGAAECDMHAEERMGEPRHIGG